MNKNKSNTPEVLLEVEDLEVEFSTGAGVVSAVDKTSF